MAASIFVFGASGHAKVVIDIIERMRDVEVAFAVDDAAHAKGSSICGYEVIGGRTELIARRQKVAAGVVTVGDNAARSDIATWLTAQGFKLANAIHPGATMARGVIIGDGTVVMAGCVVNSDTKIGTNVIVNTGATIDHDCVIGDGTHIAPGCHLCGGVTIGERSFLGAGTIVIPGVQVGADVVIGAGSTVLGNIAAGTRAAGNPAQPLRTRT